MTMVLENQGRHFGMGYDQLHYPSMQTTPSFSDPWAHQTSTSASSFPALSKMDAPRSGTSMSYSQMPPVTSSMTQGSAYPGMTMSSTDMLSYPQDIPRSTYAEPAYTSTATTSAGYAPSFSSMSYTASLQQQQQQQQQQHQSRKLSDGYVLGIPILNENF
jgi:hypothetical protein